MVSVVIFSSSLSWENIVGSNLIHFFCMNRFLGQYLQAQIANQILINRDWFKVNFFYATLLATLLRCSKKSV